jgi:hypothetical protein
MFFWLREGFVEGRAAHVGFVANSKAEVEAARRVLEGERLLGFATPANVFGGGFAESIQGTQITDV